MNALLLLIPIALLLGLLGLGAFMWAMRTGQFDDLDGAASRILFDDAPAGDDRRDATGARRLLKRFTGDLR
jgi:cbb3-type cytochrome oxidase maturation protein